MDRFEREIISFSLLGKVENADKAVMAGIEIRHKLLDIAVLLPEHTELRPMLTDLLRKSEDLIEELTKIREEAKKEREQLYKKEGEHGK